MGVVRPCSFLIIIGYSPSQSSQTTVILNSVRRHISPRCKRLSGQRSAAQRRVAKPNGFVLLRLVVKVNYRRRTGSAILWNRQTTMLGGVFVCLCVSKKDLKKISCASLGTLREVILRLPRHYLTSDWLNIEQYNPFYHFCILHNVFGISVDLVTPWLN